MVDQETRTSCVGGENGSTTPYGEDFACILALLAEASNMKTEDASARQSSCM